MFCQGIGGNNMRFPSNPFDFPSRMALKNLSSVHAPIPVGEDVKLELKLTPQGPAATVVIGPNKTHDFSAAVSMTPMPTCAGWPESALLVSTSGPRGPITFGE